MNIKIIVNPRAGDGKARETGFEVEKYFCDNGMEYSLDSTYRPLGAVSLAKKAAREGFNLIIAVGGDGTVNEVVNGMAGSASSLAVIPAGKKNNFSRMLGLNPLDIGECCEIAVGSNSKKIDLGKINGRYFLNGIGVGLNADMSEKKQRGGIAARLLSALKDLRPAKLNIKIGDLNLSSKMAVLKVANGMFDLCVLNDIGKLGMLLNLPRIAFGNLPGSRHYKIYRGSHFIIDSPDPLKAVYDGENIGESAPYHIKVAEEKLLVKTK
ncbi:MAG: diacylglycerol kinase family lipid kinase [Candidatus Saganbacteria bacterium]|nr:diacylglycerol kinase family lipid kinase [Candidatus Saganbacteria bacterium]